MMGYLIDNLLLMVQDKKNSCIDLAIFLYFMINSKILKNVKKDLQRASKL